MIDEILAHISTPATRQNDDLYLSLAEAYLEFEPHNRIGDESRQQITPDGVPMRSLRRFDAAMSGESQGSGAGRSSIASTSKESYGSFPSLLSSDDTTNNVRNVNTLAENDSVPTSSRLARLDRIHQHWKQHTTPRSSFIGGPTSTGRVPKSSSEHVDTTFADTTFIEDTQLGAQALQSQLQDDYSLTWEDTSEDEEGSTFLEESLVPLSDVVKRLADEVNGQILVSDHESSMPAVANVVATVSTSQSETFCTKEIAKASPPVLQPSFKKQKTSTNESNFGNVYDFGSLSIDIYPPPPRITIERPGKLPSQVTKHLAAIKVQNPKRFKPVRKLDIPRADDRGYWSIPCSKWPGKTQHDFWTSMSEHVSSGRLGWGVTLHRKESSQTLSNVRLYCWAELIEHTWLLIWLCSRGEVAKSGSQWLNADGKMVFEVQ